MAFLVRQLVWIQFSTNGYSSHFTCKWRQTDFASLIRFLRLIYDGFTYIVLLSYLTLPSISLEESKAKKEIGLVNCHCFSVSHRCKE